MIEASKTYDKIYKSCRLSQSKENYNVVRLPMMKTAKPAIKFFAKQKRVSETEFLFDLLNGLLSEVITEWQTSLRMDRVKPIIFDDFTRETLIHKSIQNAKLQQKTRRRKSAI